MRTICIALFAASVALIGPVSAAPTNGSESYAQATSGDQSSVKKAKAKRKRAPKVEYMRAVPAR